MKMKKILLGALALVLVVALTIAGTVAYLTTPEYTKHNVFNVGSVNIGLYEDTTGTTAEVEADENGATYTQVMPGDYLGKEVFVKNEGSSDAYVKVTVTMNNADAINVAIDEYYEELGYGAEAVQAMYDFIFDGWGLNYNKVDAEGNALGMRLTISGDDMPEYVMQVDSTKTTIVNNDTYFFGYNNWFKTAQEVTAAQNGAYGIYPAADGYYAKNLGDYEFNYTYYIDLPAGETVTLFNGFNVPEEFNATQLAMFAELEINVEASAIQKDNFDTAKAAFEALAEIEGGNALVGDPEIVWDGTVDTSWYNGVDSEYTLETAQAFAGLAKLVNDGNTFYGKTVKLGTDVCLNNKEWTPIGNKTNKFQGTFDGQNHTVSDLKISGSNSNVGLFGYTTNGEIKNLTVKNADVSGYLEVGVVAGSPYTSKYTNITVTGHVEVNGMAYVGGVGGKNVYANWDNITVDVDATSYVSANSVENGTAYRTYVGGVIGFAAEGRHTISNVYSNIDVIGTTCDVGGITGIAHYGNTFKNIVCEGDVKITDAAEAGDAEEIGGIAGVWFDKTGYTVTFTNCKFNGTLTVNLTEGVDLSDNTLVGKAYNENGTGKLIIDGGVAVADADALVEALENGEDVTLMSDVKIDPASMSNAYGKTGINVKNGQTIDGNGFVLDIKDAGGTWDSGINTTGGLIKNITVTGSFRGIFINHNSTVSSKVILENVIIDGTVYTISCDQGTNNGLEATGCTFNGWTSYAATLGNATFTDCSFGEGNGYAYCRPYAPTAFVGCDFEAGYEMDPRAAVTFENCTIDGKPLTADNLADLVTSNIQNATVIK